MADEGENDNQSIIPDSAVNTEKKNVSASGDDKLAKSEEESIDKGNYNQQVKDSKDINTLAHHSLYRWGIRIIFILSCLALTFILSVFACLVYHYMKTLIGEPEKLEDFLEKVWTVMMGASVVAFLQLIAWIVKRKADESERS